MPDTHLKRGARSTSRRVLLVAIWLTVVVGLVELFSLLGWYLIDGNRFSYREAASARSVLQAEATALTDADAEEPTEALSGLALRLRGQVLHPFLGYVFSPEFNRSAERQRSHLEIDESGFWRRRGATSPEGATRIGIFGGSVAFLFAFQGENTLRAELRKPLGSAVAVENRAFAGYKQPQQLMTLAWLRALDEAPDIVINVDGFNDLVLPIAENLSQGVNPYYPREWEFRVREVPDPQFQALVGEARYLERRRAELADSFSQPVLRWSVFWNLLWRWQDGRVAARVGALERRLADFEMADTPWVAHGPPYHAPSTEAAIADAVAFWERSSLQMHQLAEAAGLRYYHFLQPNQYVEDSKPLSAQERRVAIDPSNPYAEPAIQGYSALQAGGERLRRQGVHFADLTQVFAGVEEPLYIDSCCHFNQRGNVLLARAISEVIKQDLAN